MDTQERICPLGGRPLLQGSSSLPRPYATVRSAAMGIHSGPGSESLTVGLALLGDRHTGGVDLTRGLVHVDVNAATD